MDRFFIKVVVLKLCYWKLT